MFNFVEFVLSLFDTQPAPPAREFATAPPEKEHRLDQLALAQELNGAKEIAQALEINDQDRGGLPNQVGYITQLKQEIAMSEQAVTILVKGSRFMAPDGWKIKEVRPRPEMGADVSRVIFYGSIIKGRKLNNELQGSRFSLVRR